MRQLRYYFRLTVAFLSRFKGLLAIGVVFGILVFFTARVLASNFLSRSVERIGVNGRYHPDSLPSFILELIGDGLTHIDETGTAEPSLAYSWETPDKGKTWVFKLAPGKTWQDETPVDSNSIIYQFSDVVIEKPDDKTISFQLEDPFIPFPVAVSRPTFRQGLLGTGEWKVEHISVAGGFVQELTLTNQKKDKKIYKFYPTSERTKLAYKLGEVDKLINMLDQTPFNDWDTANVNSVINKNQVVTLFFNVSDSLLSDKSLRQALIYAINKEDLGGERAISPISPDSWAYNPQVKPYTKDTDRAKELLETLPDELLNKDPIKLVTTPILLPVAEQIANYWNELGVNTVVLVSSIVPAEFQVFLTIFDIPKDPDQYAIWHSTQEATNISNYQNARIDKLLEDGRTELNVEERRKIYLDFQRFLLEDLPAAFLYHPTYYSVTRK